MVENFNLEEHSPPIVTMADQHTMAELLRVPTEGYAEAIVVLPILAEQFELKHSLINIMTTDKFFRLEKDNSHDHIRAARQWLEKEPPRSITTWEDLVSKFINEFFPSSRTTNLRNEISKFQQRFDESFHEAWDRYKDLLHQDSLNAAAEIAKLTHAVNQQTSAVTTAMMAMLKQFQATPPPAPVKAVDETCVTCGGAHPYYQCLTAGGNTFLELRDNIQGYVSAAVVNYNQGSGSLPSNTIANPKGKLKAITTRSGLVIDGPTVPIPLQSINLEVDERVKKTFTGPYLAEYTIKVPPPLIQKYKPPSQIEVVMNQRGPRHPNIPYPSRMLKQKQQEKDKVQIQKFWPMFKQLHINITLADALILMPKYQKMLIALLSNKEKLQELENTPLNENCSAVILKKLPEKLGDPGKFLILCGFSELKCKALADLADFIIVDYESDPRVLLILGRPFLRTARALIDVHESINLINVFNNSSEDFLEELFPNQPSGNSTFLPHPELTSSEVNNDIFDSEGCNVLSDKLPDLDSTKELHPPFHDNPLSGSTTYFSNPLLEEFADELPPKYDDNLQFDIESDLKEIEFLLYQDKDSSLKDSIDQKNLANLVDIFVDSIPKMFIDEHTLDYSFDIG
nr:reverse transcriptase domain-containing protein [Tanacetum cinerariifolium]